MVNSKKKIDFRDARLKPIERTSIASIVATQLLDELAKNNFASGTRLPSEREMADALGVGRSTLREALAALDLLGIVEVRPGSGSYLKTDSSQLLPQALQWGLMLAQPEVQDLVEVREHLELLAAMLAAQRASDEDLERLELHLVRMQDSATSVEDFVEADIAFHIETAIIARNTVLEGLLESIRSLLRVWFDRTLRVEGTMKETVTEHQAVFDAIARRSPLEAERRMKILMDKADQRLKQTL